MHILISSLSRFTRPTGICRHAANLARCLSDLSKIDKITLLVGQWQEEYFRTAFDIHSSKIEVVPVAIANRQLARNQWFAFGLPEVAKVFRPDIVHLGFPMPVIRSLFPCPVVVTVHDLYPYDYPEVFVSFNGFCRRTFIRRCMKACDAVTCVSESTRRSLARHFPELSSRVPVRVVYNYADFPAVPDPPTPDSDPRPFLLSVAQHQPNKRLDLLLKAFARLRFERRIREDFQLLVVGSEGSQSEKLRQLANALHLNTCVHWVPPVSDRQLAWLYQSCAAFVATSCIEGFCLPLLEALFFNCRVVASELPIFEEIAGKVPFYFNISQNPVENLAGAIVQALNASPPSQSGPQRFSRSNTAKECLSLYSLVLHESTAAERPRQPLAASE